MNSWIRHLNNDPIDWLLDSNPWTKFKTYQDLLGFKESDSELATAKQELIDDKRINDLAKQTKDWLSISATRNSDPKITYFKLKALAEFGLRHSDLDLQETIDKATEHVVEDMFGVRGKTPVRPEKGVPFEKPDLAADVWHVSPCNSPIITTALLDLGVKNILVDNAIEELKQRWTSPEGWFCHFFFVDNQFNKLKIGCPIAGLQALEVFSKVTALRESEYSRYAFEPIKYHKEYGKTLYYFGRSRKFWTFKYPFVWYNALYLADVLTRFDFLKREPVVEELVEWIIRSQDIDGRFRPTSVFMIYKGWDFANKKEASPWITFLCCRILKQYFG